MSYDQSKAQMAIWTILAAPLIMSNDLKNIRPEIKEILLNKNIIEVNQDILGIQGKRMAVAEGIEVIFVYYYSFVRSKLMFEILGLGETNHANKL